MAQSDRVALILGSGPNVGSHVAQLFASAGYKVAVVSRSGKYPDPNTVDLTVIADLVDPNAVRHAFEEVRTKLGEPSVVNYNGVAWSNLQSDPLTVDLKTFQDHLSINTISAFMAAQEAVKSFNRLTENPTPPVFIYTGNKLNLDAFPPLLTLGVGKAASSHIIEYFSKIYREKGYGFYYADERTADGGAAGNDIDGEAHAEFFLGLAHKTEIADYLQTFVKGQGYVKF